MSAASDELYRTIEQNYLTSADWGAVNITMPGGQQLQSVVDEMVKDKFGGYRKNKYVTIGTTRYKCRMLPPQNKFSRSKRSYGANSFEGAESYANLEIFEAKHNGTKMLNMHIILKTLAAEHRAAQKAAKNTPDADGWITP